MTETLQKERNEHATAKSGQDKRMEEIMTKGKAMIDESTQAERLMAEKSLKEERTKANAKLARELTKADEKLACGLAKGDEKLAGELNKRIDELQSELHSSEDHADGMFYKLQEVKAVTADTFEWISLGVCPWSNQHLPKLTQTVTGHSLTGSNQSVKHAQHRAGKTCLSTQLTDTPTGASLIWRDRLGYTQDFATRLCHRQRSFTPGTCPA